ncbi:hypothetical protein PRUPE_5G095300 [Prunus persica]|uniref:Uncharacterized protein n=1 Tax=Prunus persica TaxID=3760 RepID=A0A251P605_PRUPE|nr:hypothetical protein PRUPE_5G095300 [Prunus persica]
MTVVEYGIHLRRNVFRHNTSYLRHEKEIVYKSKLYLQHVHIYSSDIITLTKFNHAMVPLTLCRTLSDKKETY